MNTLLKDRVTQYKMDFHDNQMDIKMVEDRIDLTRKYLREMEDDYKTTLEGKEDEILELEKRSVDVLAKVSKIELEIDSINLKIQKFTEKDVKSKSTEFTSKTSVFMKDLRHAEKQIKFFETNTECPTCHQDIDEYFRSTKIENLHEEVNTLKTDIDSVQEMLRKIKKLQDMYENLSTNLSSKMIERSTLASDLSHIQKGITRLNDEIKSLKNKREQRDSSFDDLDDLCSRKNDLLTQKQELLDDKDLLVSAGYLLKEGGIKTKIIKQYVPIMNKLIAKYLAEMDFYVQFELDEEFNETILSRYRDSFSYESFSEGEKFRIDLALLFTWRSIAKLRNSTTCNLLILDEIFDSSLDASGTDEFLKIMDSLTENTNVFIISHRLDTMVDKFENLIQFKKENNFSKMVKE
jgi:DNA repair exonuclease SbcCD ATPase subunit